MIYLILILFLISIIFAIVNVVKRDGINSFSIISILLEIFRLRGIFFCIFYVYVCIEMMQKVSDASKWVLLPFLICGIAMILCMYKKTVKIGSCIFAGTFIGSFFIIFPLMGADSENIVGVLFFVVIGIILGYYIFKEIFKK